MMVDSSPTNLFFSIATASTASAISVWHCSLINVTSLTSTSGAVSSIFFQKSTRFVLVSNVRIDRSFQKAMSAVVRTEASEGKNAEASINLNDMAGHKG